MRRRQFIQASSLAGLSIGIPGPWVRRRHFRYSLALVGSGWWGVNILREAIRSGEVDVVALCDVDERQLDRAAAEVGKLCTDRPRRYKDFRDCLDRERPDIVINATPDHWHALVAIAALRSGAHLFLEKPIGHTVKEGTAIQQAVVDTGKVCIVDFHRRYSPHNVSGMEFLRAGKAGEIREVKAFVHYSGSRPEPLAEEEVPAGLDWDFYCGPAEKVAYRSAIHPRRWRQYGCFANGQLGDWAPHWFDQILWWTEEKAPRTIFGTARYHPESSAGDMPASQVVTYAFESFTCTWEHSLFNRRPQQPGENVGVHFYGSLGTFHMGWQQGWTFHPHDSKQEIIRQAPALDEPDSQNIRLVWQDFMTAIKTGASPFAGIEQGRQATNMALLGMLSTRLGRSITWDAVHDRVLDDPAADDMLRRDYRGPWKYPEAK